MLLADLLFSSFFCFFGGLLPVMLVAYLVRRFGPAILVTVGAISSISVAALYIHIVGEAPFLSQTHLFFGAIIMAGGLAGTWFDFIETKFAVISLVGYEAGVNDLLENHWHCLDEQGVGFLSYGALRHLDNTLEEGTKFQCVVKHMLRHFSDIAISSAGTSIITPAIAHKYIDGVRVKYAKWLPFVEREQKKHVCNSKCPITCGASTSRN